MKIQSLALASLTVVASPAGAFLPSPPSCVARRGAPAPPSDANANGILAPSSLGMTATEPASEEVSPAFADLGLAHPPVRLFGKGHSGSSDKALLGGKGANLAEMSSIGLSVPPGFTITTECCDGYCNRWDSALPPALWEEVTAGVKSIEEGTGCGFGEEGNPLLLSVRSGAAISMPGMMDTVLNLGMNDAVCEGLAKRTGNDRFAWDSYRRFLEMFGNVVLEIPRSAFEEEIDDVKYEKSVYEDSDLTTDDLKEVVARFKSVYEKANLSFPQDAYEQLSLAIGAVFGGWMGARAVKYREVENIRNLLGTAVNVQAMVFGNMGDTSGTGVCFTRDPNNGEDDLFGEFLVNAQGEDVVAGIRTPRPISELETEMPEVYKEFKSNTDILEGHYGDMQDVEFTIQEGQLYMLQTRTGKRGGEAAVKIAVDLVEQGFVTKEEAITKVLPEHLDQLLHPRFSDVESGGYKDSVVARGLPASPGAAVGRIALTNEKVVENKEDGVPSILVRDETSPDDVEGMYGAEGILTARGGMTSHAAVVARGWGRPCICGCGSMSVNEESGEITVTLEDGTTKTFKEGDFLSLNGNTGEVLLGEQLVAPPAITGNLKTFMDWVDEIREIDVLANADTPNDAREARKNGANGIGLCRTEHQTAALEELLVFQRTDFEGIFKEMDGVPVTIRLLDPPLHEFLPSLEDEEILSALASELQSGTDQLVEQIKGQQEVNPMLGLRGCRLGITKPAVIEMQTRAVIEAALNAIDAGVDAKPDIMVPLVGKVEEFRTQAALIKSVAAKVFEERGKTCDFKVGTMIEIPRAALTSHKIAEEADFFSFGSNDLTQMTFGYSRDDVGTFLPTYLENGVLLDDPFVTIDTEGVGSLIKMTVENGRAVKPSLKIGVCGEHGGDPRSVEFFSNEAGLTYVSCSPFRVPIARLAAAQAAVKQD